MNTGAIHDDSSAANEAPSQPGHTTRHPSPKIRRKAATLAILTLITSMTLVGVSAQAAKADCHDFYVASVDVVEANGGWHVLVTYRNGHGEVEECYYNTYLSSGEPISLVGWECTPYGRVRVYVIYNGEWRQITTYCQC